MRYLIKNGSIIDPSQRIATIGDVLIEDGRVVQIMDLTDLRGERELVGDDVEVINARGCVVAPGFIDMHTHLREPGEEHRETVATATLAAAHGGFTTICAMPDTRPAVDRSAVARQVRELARRRGHVRVEIIAALTQGREGRALSEMAELVEAGAVAFSDNPASVADARLMRSAMAYAAMLGVPVMSHCEDPRLSGMWAMHEGVVSTRLGLPGTPSSAEQAMIARDIALAEETGVHLHICTVSTSGGVAQIRAAKQRGVRVTAEVTPHHLTMSDHWVLGSMAVDMAVDAAPQTRPATRVRRARVQAAGLPSRLDPRLLPPYDTSTRICPPLRTTEDVEALVEGLRDGTIDLIATDHTPLAIEDKQLEYGVAACGISALETALGLVLTLVHRGELDLVELVARLTEGPAQVLGRAPNNLRPGSRADVVIFDPEAVWTVDAGQFMSRGHNTPLHGQQLRGQVMLTMVGGAMVFRRPNFGTPEARSRPNISRLEGILPEEPA